MNSFWTTLKRTLYALLIFGAYVPLSAQCTYDIDMFDSFGDGWNGGFLEVFVNGTSIGTYAATGTGSSANFVAPPGSTVEFFYTAGIFEGENTYDVYQGGNLVFSDGPTPATGSVFTSNCAANAPEDAAVIAMNSPTNPIPAGLAPVEVRIKNWGTDTLYSVNIEWEFNGTPQPMVIYPGLPLAPQDEADVNLGNLNLTGNNFNFRFWTTMPNGVADGQPANDTLDVDFCRALNGVYTVGAPASDYLTIDDAIAALASCGVDGPVTFNVEPGTYVGPYTLTEVSGASATNRITFDGGTNATITHDGSGQNAALLLDGADYMTIQNFNVTNTNGTGGDNLYGIQLTNSANNNRIWYNYITMEYSTGVFNSGGVVFSGSLTSMFTEGDNANFNQVEYNVITGGEQGIHVEGSFADRNSQNSFNYNTIYNVDDYGMYIDDQDSLEINENLIYDLRSNFADGIYCFDIMDFVISKNNVNAPDYGIYISDGNFDAVPTRRGRVLNNMSFSATDAAFYFDDVQETDFIHNTGKGDRGMYFNDPALMDIRNNIFYGVGDYAYESPDAVNMDAMDNNLYYTESGAFLIRYGTDYVDLLAWQALGLYDLNSVEGDPGFLANDDLHVLGLLADNAGDNAVLIFSDIDGDSRPGTGGIVDIGADEYTPLTTDAAAIELLQPMTPLCGDSNQVVEVVIYNNGTNDITSMDITAEVNGTPLTVNYTGPLPFGQSDTVTLGTINTYAGGFYDFLIYTSLPGEQNVLNDTLNLTIGVAPSTPLVAVNDSICPGGIAELMVEASPGLILSWYDAPSGGNLVYQGDVMTLAGITADSTLYVEGEIGGTCTYTLDMFDSFGDGWNGGNLEIFVGGVSIGTFFATGNGSSAVITAGFGESVELVYSSGAWEGENTYFLYDDTGALIFNDGPNPTVGSVFITSCGGGAGACNPARTAVTAVMVTPPTLDLGPDTAICSGLPLTLDADIMNSTTFVWSTNEITPQITVNTGGTYFVRAYNSYDCEARDTIVVTVNADPTVAEAITMPSCAGDADGAIDLTMTSGVAPYTFAWDNAATTEDVTGLAAGTYMVTITDANGCPLTVDYTLMDPGAVSATSVITDATCNTNNDGAVDLTVTGGNAPYTFTWDNGATTEDLTAVSGNTYNVTVTDDNGCTATSSHSVSVPNPITITLDSIQDETVDIGGGIYITLAGGTAPYFITWNNGQPTEDLVGVVAATYTVTVTDANGCTATETYTVQYDIPFSSVDDIASINTMSVYPNPTQDLVWVEMDLAESVEVSIEVYDALGRQLQQIAPQNGLTQRHELNLSDYPAGVYMLRMVIGEDVLTEQIILDRP